MNHYRDSGYNYIYFSGIWFAKHIEMYCWIYMHKNAVLIEVVQWIMVLDLLLNLQTDINQNLLDIFWEAGMNLKLLIN